MKGRAWITDKRVVCSLSLLACLLWGSAYPAIKTGYSLFSIGPDDTAGKFLFAGYRFFAAGLFLIGFCAATGRKAFDIGAGLFGRLALLGVGMTTLQYIFFYIGLSHTTGVKGAIMNGTTTFFSVIAAHFVFKAERLTARVVAGCVIGFLGVIFVNFSRDLLDLHFTFTGEGFLVIAALVLAVSSIYGKVISQGMDSVVMTAWQLSIGGVLLIVLGYAMGGSLTGFTPASTALLCYMALLSSAAFAIMATLLKHNPVSLFSIFQFTVPIFGAALSAMFLGEKLLEWKNLVALVCVCAGIFLVTYVREPKKKS
ncbi:DMT family transporter [Ereboglobus luteus]|uniref:EamA family transporter n=1 Tax=Ereboglobus luteus TaxID=1796921 RepID=A0A2U8E734_9BACT|nr:DMT family transporter [Ereboglobus luteus]AWI10667.1 EamA family transporter [Ereboglobus luteus]